jgi:hypothetical protein
MLRLTTAPNGFRDVIVVSRQPKPRADAPFCNSDSSAATCAIARRCLRSLVLIQLVALTSWLEAAVGCFSTRHCKATDYRRHSRCRGGLLLGAASLAALCSARLRARWPNVDRFHLARLGLDCNFYRYCLCRAERRAQVFRYPPQG